MREKKETDSLEKPVFGEVKEESSDRSSDKKQVKGVTLKRKERISRKRR